LFDDLGALFRRRKKDEHEEEEHAPVIAAPVVDAYRPDG
jgi:hypothetical protein